MSFLSQQSSETHFHGSVLANMSWEQQFRPYLWLLRILGLLPGEFCRVRQKFVSTETDLRRGLFTTVLVVCLVEGLLIWNIIASFEDRLDLFPSNKTANNLIVLQLVFCGLVEFGIGLAFFLNRGKHLTLLNVLFKQALQLPKTKRSAALAKRLRSMFWLNVVIFMLFELNLLHDILDAGADFTSPVVISSYMLLTIHMFYGISVMSTYTAIVLIIRYILQSYNDKLSLRCADRALSYREVLSVVALLRSRSELLQMCFTHMNQVYGLPMVLEAFFLLCSVPQLAFFLKVVLDYGVPDLQMFLMFCLNCCLWLFPPLVVFIIALKANNIILEANRTARILSRVPRTGAGIEKMVEKFLLKNLRQKPILTAYGFFSLDKSTLFKLFTAISTYMVILVQFKEMESAKGAAPTAL